MIYNVGEGTVAQSCGKQRATATATTPPSPPELCSCRLVVERESMVSREHKRTAAALHEKLQLLRSITNSHAVNETSIVVDASNYIQELKHKVNRLNQDIAATTGGQTSTRQQQPLPVVKVETLEKGFRIIVFSDKTCPGLLVSILEAFEDLGLNVLEARVSCTDSFRLEAVGGGGEEQNEEEQGENMNAQAVKQAVLETIRNWSESSDHQQK